ncbi:MAG: hypothetical protein KGI37_06560 [Alphaproteobacteria bacterium]|nr:hypothetical protein [Alphaproteobacteria bacterium]
MNPNEAEYFRSIGRLEGQVAALVSTTSDMKAKIDSIDVRLDTLDRMANRWKGGFAVILGIGAFIGFVIDHALKWITQR